MHYYDINIIHPFSFDFSKLVSDRYFQLVTVSTRDDYISALLLGQGLLVVDC